jgi:hypothetical protein
MAAEPASTTISISAKDLHLDDAPTTIGGSQIETLLMNVYIVAGIVAVIVIIVGGIRYTTSGGDASGVKAAKDTILYAVVGLVVIIMAAAITDFVIKNVAK